jgi:O-acetyl-ADP-ribose deacetylase (regulator of RNase III)
VTEAAPIAISAALDALHSARHVITVRFVLFDLSTLRAYERAASAPQRLNTTVPFTIQNQQPLMK